MPQRVSLTPDGVVAVAVAGGVDGDVGVDVAATALSVAELGPAGWQRPVREQPPVAKHPDPSFDS